MCQRTKYPDDDEAQIAYAITLNTSADLNDKSYAQQTKDKQARAVIDDMVRETDFQGNRFGCPLCAGRRAGTLCR